jgi:hypothetical protein
MVLQTTCNLLIPLAPNVHSFAAKLWKYLIVTVPERQVAALSLSSLAQRLNRFPAGSFTGGFTACVRLLASLSCRMAARVAVPRATYLRMIFSTQT